MIDPKDIYRKRFSGEDTFRNGMWRILCRDFFQRYIPSGATVIDVAAGYCEFINNIVAGRKIALDVNPDVKARALSDVEVVVSRSTDMSGVKTGSCDVAFVSNFFEHITKDDIVATINEVRRVLKSGGLFLVLQPNIRFCGNAYWSFFDHITPLDDKSLGEILSVCGFEIVESRPRFLPYTTKSALPKSLFLIALYLKMPFVQGIFGQQSFLAAKRM